MRNRIALFACLSATCAVAHAADALPGLTALEARIGQAPAAQLAEREFRAQRDTVAAARTELGISAFGTIGGAHNHDIIDPTHSYTYDQGLIGAGLELPLLGSRLQIEGHIQTDRIHLARLAGQVALTRRDLIGRLRKAYAAYWQSAQISQLAHRYLAAEPRTARELALRTRTGVTLDAERLSVLAAFAGARRDAIAAAADRRAALTIMSDLTGLHLHAGAAPRVPDSCIAAAATDRHWRAGDPRLHTLRQIIALRRADPRVSGAYPVQSNLQLSVQGEDQVTTGQHGASAALVWWVKIPLGYRAERRRLTAAARERLASARLAYRLQVQTLSARRRGLLDQLTVLRQARALAQQQFAAAKEAVRERALRAQKLAGDARLRLLRAQQTRYSAHTALVDAEAALISWYGDWARFDPAACAAIASSPDGKTGTPANTQSINASHPTVGAVTARGRGIYLWRAAQWLRATDNDEAQKRFTALHAAGVTDLRISLNAREMARALADPRRLRKAVRLTRKHGFTVELLLGDPRWIRATHRAQLLHILNGLRTVPFDGVSLDLEPGELHGSRAQLPALLASLAHTLRAANRTSAWPLDLDIRPADLTILVHGVAFGKRLERLHARVTLMIYLANPRRVAAIARPLFARFPRLRFHVALSLEKSLPAGQSLRPYSPLERRRRVDRVQRALVSPNFAGLVFELADGWREVGLLPTVRG